jgi:hypothetical protein
MLLFMTFTSLHGQKQSAQQHEKFEHVLNRGRVGIEPASVTAAVDYYRFGVRNSRPNADPNRHARGGQTMA